MARITHTRLRLPTTTTYQRADWLRPWLMLMLWSLLLPTHDAFGQVARDTTAVRQDDRSPLRVRYPKENHLNDLQTDHDYQYGNDAPPPDNPIARFFDWLFRRIDDFFRSEAYTNVWQYVFLVAIAGLVVYLLTKIDSFQFLFPKRALSQGLAYENLAEDVHTIDFNAAIEETIQQRNFRLAVRLLYLQTLKYLTDAGKIQYKPDKTNRQYVYELANSPLQAGFTELTRQFNFVWYGDFAVDEASFGTIHQQFRQFNALIPTNVANSVP